ncbi:hypothetical protein [Agarilytica rhodophyticola]|uniref:hypothetical protein n=1 Tax=Agarilytica rhodophyticola TaxID=1737490 RepID=UPI000B34612F|nr:hypothetical protein [Agarilytica rhodophyticola]
MVLTHKPKPGITADASTNEWKFDLNSGQPKISLDVSSNEAGQYHIMFHAQISHAGQNSSRVFGIPVYVGDQSSPAIQKKHPEVISMKAQETVN